MEHKFKLLNLLKAIASMQKATHLKAFVKITEHMIQTTQLSDMDLEHIFSSTFFTFLFHVEYFSIALSIYFAVSELSTRDFRSS